MSTFVHQDIVEKLSGSAVLFSQPHSAVIIHVSFVKSLYKVPIKVPLFL